MSFPNLLFLLSTACFFLAFRIFETTNALVASSFLLVFGMLVGFGLQFASFRKAKDGKKIAFKRWLQFAVLVFAGVFGFLSAHLIQELVTIDSKYYDGISKAIWASLVVIGIVGVVILDFVNRASPVLLPSIFVKKGTHAAVIVGLGFLLLFPTNYIVHQTNFRYDASFFKTASPGDSTIKITKEATSPFVAYVFSGASSEVGIELADYFAELKKSAPIRVELVDQVAQPKLSKKLKIRDNGYVVISTEAIASKDKPSIEDKMSKRAVRPQRIRIGSNIDDKQVKDKLRNFDAKVRKAMIALERGRLSAYVTTGHSELTWKDKKPTPLRNIRVFKEGLESYNFRLKTFGVADGLATKVPKNAAVLLVLGPDLGLTENEYLSIKKYLEDGGAALLAIEAPEFREANALGDKVDYTDALLKWLGIGFEEGVLLSKSGMQPVTRSKQDHMHFVTKQFDKHPSLSTINAQSSQSFGLFLSTPGALKVLDKKEGRVLKTVVRSPSGSWMETNRNLEIDSGELRGSRPVGIAVETEKWRAFVTSDASLFSDFAMQNTGNQQFSLDVVNWLSRLETQTGTLSSEADLPFTPTKKGQAIWFYLSILGIPVFVLIFGWIRIRRRKQEKN